MDEYEKLEKELDSEPEPNKRKPLASKIEPGGPGLQNGSKLVNN